MFDFNMIGLTRFDATAVTVVPVTNRAREAFQNWLGAGASSCQIRKSRIQEIIDAIEDAGFTYTDGGAL